MNNIEQNVDTTIAVSPDSDEDTPPTRADAGTDESIAERLERNPDSKQARLDRALDESMDASDPPATTQPVHNHGPAPSSGYDEDAERKLQSGS
jgi:hypothetical protein